MFEDPAMNEFFGEVKQEPTAKRRRPEENNKFGPQRAKGGNTEELVTTLARLAIKQEEELQVLKQDHSFMLFMRPGKDTVLTFLFQTATLFKKKQEESPTWGADFQPLRVVLSLALFRELATRIEAVEQDEAKLKEIKDLGCMTPDLKWKFQVWNPTLRHLQEDKSRLPLTTTDIKTLLERLYSAIKTDIVTRFCCTRKLTESMETQATFYFDLSCRSKGQEAWEVMTQLQGSCVLQLIGLAYKRAGLRRGPMAQKLRELLNAR